MAITTLDGVIAGAQQPRFFTKSMAAAAVVGRPASLWAGAGIPGPGSYDTTLNGVTLSGTSSNVAGQIPFTDPVSGNSYLSRLVPSVAGSAGMFLLLDRIWHNGGFTITSTSAQSITSPTFPTRDADGTSNGNGILLAVEVSSATGAGTPTITVSYTNEAGTSGRTATNIDATAASSVAGSMFRLGLQAGDKGVRSVQSLTLSATWTSGTMNLVAYRVLASIDIAVSASANSIDAVTSGFPRLYNGTVPYCAFIAAAAGSSLTTGMMAVTQG